VTTDPLALFDAWLDEARQTEPNDPEAMAVATVGPDAQPSVRMVLLKRRDARGFTFHTNAESRKGDELAANPRAALLFHWKTLRRQVRVEGPAERVTDAEADAYFATRSRGSRLSAWASDQSRPLASRAEFERRVADATARFEGQDVTRPPYWSGFRVAPERIEFWSDREFRMHERRLFLPDGAGGWTESLLFP
jgi:pyridoxamine 5'-phosphate oxidase